MGLMSEYIDAITNKGLNLEAELLSLIAKYNKQRNTFLLVYASAIGKPIPDVVLTQEDYYIIVDLLKNKTEKKIDIYLETPGGSGEAAEEIVVYLHSRYDLVSFVVSGEAKSAGTLMVLSGDEILMTETGSLGPIDAQIKIGRSIGSAYDYLEWVREKQEEANKTKKLNPFDAVMVAQISPAELKGVSHALEYAEDLVVPWLTKYKFKHWNVTKTTLTPVTDKMKEKRAKEIYKEFVNHRKWRSHGRSIKIVDLEAMKLEITKIDEPILKDIVCRIQIVCRILFTITGTYKIFAIEGEKIFKQAGEIVPAIKAPNVPKNVEVGEVKIKCPKCQKEYCLYMKFVPKDQIDHDFKAKGCLPFPLNNKLSCECGTEINLEDTRKEIESKIGKKIVE